MTVIISGDNGVSDVDGSAGTPAIRGTDANTGIFFGSDVIGFSEGGAECARFNADAQFVAAAGTASLPVITTTGDVNTGIFFPAADTIAFAEGGAEAMRIDSDGDVGIGTTTPVSKLHIGAGNISLSYADGSTGLRNKIRWTTESPFFDEAAYIAVNRTAVSNAPTDIVFATTTAVATPPAERARITSGGDLLVGTTSAGTGKVRIDGVTGGVNLFCNYPNPDDGVRIDANTAGSAGTSVYILPVRTAGTLRGGIQWNGSNLLYNNSSDYRLKENIAPMTGALNKVAALKPCTYTWKETGISGQGFIAHELQEIVPDCVTGEKDAVNEDGSIKPQGIDTSFLVATLTAAIQELKAINDAQASRIETLEAKVAALEAK